MVIRLTAAFSTAAFEKGNVASRPFAQMSNWSLKCGDLGSPLWPIGITWLVESQSLGIVMCRIETFEPTFGDCPLPAIATVGV